jgi:Family of unknown function (DUF5716)
MRARPDLWGEGDDFGEALPEMISTARRRMRRADKALSVARQIYPPLVATAWLEEEEYGLRVTLDMPMASLLVLERFASLNRGVSERFGGRVVQIRLGLEGVAKSTPAVTNRAQRESALARWAARQPAAGSRPISSQKVCGRSWPISSASGAS